MGDFLKDIFDLFEKMFLKNCLVGISKFCVGFVDNFICHDLLFSLFDFFFLDFVLCFGRILVDVIGFDVGFVKIIGFYIWYFFIVGIMIIFFGVLIFVVLFYGWFFKCRVFVFRVVIVVVYVVFEFLFCVLFFVLVVVIYFLCLSFSYIFVWIEVYYGNVYSFCIGCFCCGIVVVVIGGFVLFY